MTSNQVPSNALSERILAAVDAAGLDRKELTYKDLLAFDQLHIGGVEQTRAMAAAVGLQADEEVLDIGCGIGGAARVLAIEYGARVLAVDQSSEYVETASALTHLVGLDQRITYEHKTAPGLNLSAESIDVAWLQLVLMNIAHKSELFQELRLLLRPGGRLVLFDVVAAKPDVTIEYPVVWAENESESFLVTTEEHRTLLSDAGFADIEITDYTPKALAWYDEIRDSRRRLRSPLSVALVLGEAAGKKSRNIYQALRSGEISPVLLVARSSQ